MALLDMIWRSGLQAFEGDGCSVHEAAASSLMFRYRDEREAFEFPSGQSLPHDHDEDELRVIVRRIKRLVDLWSIFREVSNIAELCERAKAKLVNLDLPNSAGRLSYLSEDERVYGHAIRAAGEKSDTETVQDGVLALAAIGWYAVQVRHLIARVGDGDTNEVDWFWTTFGEHHHLNVIGFRNELAHFDNLDPSDLRDNIDWFVEWLTCLAEKIRRTCIAVPDKEGMTEAVFQTGQIAQLPSVEGEDVSASNSLVQLGIEPGPTSQPEHPVKFNFISFDPETRRLTPHSDDFRFIKGVLLR